MDMLSNAFDKTSENAQSDDKRDLLRAFAEDQAVKDCVAQTSVQLGYIEGILTRCPVERRAGKLKLILNLDSIAKIKANIAHTAIVLSMFMMKMMMEGLTDLL